MQEIFLASGIGLLWGITNPFLEQGAKEISNQDNTQEENKRRCFLVRWMLFFWKLFINCRFFVPFALNQAGSLLFYYALGNSSKLPNIMKQSRHNIGRSGIKLHKLYNNVHM